MQVIVKATIFNNFLIECHSTSKVNVVPVMNKTLIKGGSISIKYTYINPSYLFSI